MLFNGKKRFEGWKTCSESEWIAVHTGFGIKISHPLNPPFRIDQPRLRHPMFVPKQNASKIQEAAHPSEFKTRRVWSNSWSATRSQTSLGSPSWQDATQVVGNRWYLMLWRTHLCLSDAELIQWNLPEIWPMSEIEREPHKSKSRRYQDTNWHIHFGCGSNIGCHVGHKCVPF